MAKFKIIRKTAETPENTKLPLAIFLLNKCTIHLDSYVPAPDESEYGSWQNWTELYQVQGVDYVKYRQGLMHTASAEWGEYSDEIKKSIFLMQYVFPFASYPTTDPEYSILMTEEEKQVSWECILGPTKQDRSNRVEAYRKAVSRTMAQIDQADLFLSNELYLNRYVESDLPYLYLWLTNGVYAPLGIDFTNDGLAQKSYFKQSMVDQANEIFIMGNYYKT